MLRMGASSANVEFAVFPQERLTITVLSNRDPPMATDRCSSGDTSTSPVFSS